MARVSAQLCYLLLIMSVLALSIESASIGYADPDVGANIQNKRLFGFVRKNKHLIWRAIVKGVKAIVVEINQGIKEKKQAEEYSSTT
ncbi:Hypothetical predicted protein [Cloeon dipterum]|uniref:Uncharacterized protein n=1 Tax=Cloeon dipterum TaxID=197152 RepID=A0A8S1CMJ7_9INSE|nr:Hypothetical predicted protein [Cloeon dipterum]